MDPDNEPLASRLRQQSPAILELLRTGGAPGLSAGVFHKGRVVYTEHHGQRDVESTESPNDDSVYWVASTFKIVTVCAVARLITDGVLRWDAPIHEYLPDLQRADKFGNECTIRDLVSNRTGLPMANFYWGQQNGELLSPKTEFVRIVNTLPTVRPLRSTFVYSQWNFCLLHLIVERVTGKTFGVFMQETIFDPLGLKTATFDTPNVTNIMRPHANRDDGRACKIRISSFDSSTGLAAGGGAKSSIGDQLTLYIALLAAYNHQHANDVDVTPGSPFSQLRTIFSPHIAVPGSQVERQAYCLGLYRTILPGNLSCASLNSALPKKQQFIFGEAKSGFADLNEEVFHHSATTPGFMGAMFLIPRTQSGVVVHTNGTSRLDTADFSAQLLLSVVLNRDPPQVFQSLSKAVVKMQYGWFHKLNVFLESCRTDVAPTHPLSAYAGNYWNAAQNFKIVVTLHGTGLHLSIQGMPVTSYDLQPCDGDTFYWPASREHELVDRGMWFLPLPQFHLVSFNTDVESVLSLVWQHERLMDPEVFAKVDTIAQPKL